MQGKFRLIAILAPLLASPLSVAGEVVIVPAWTVQVVSPEGTPIQGAKIQQVWQHYAYESDSHEQTITTDAAGNASFPERRISVNPIMHVLGPVRSFFESGIHASYNASSWLLVVGNPGLRGEAIYIPGRPRPSTIVVRHVQN